MWPRKQIVDLPKRKTTVEQQPKQSSSSKDDTKTKGEKRTLKEDRYDEQSSEFLRRKHKFIKSTVRVDYQPDICKDYKQTGFCGYGDSCKFLHDRSDYKHGWQIEQEWSKGEYKEEDDDKYLIERSDDEEEKEKSDTAKCVICKEPYKDPIVTKCKHNFCGGCAEKECNEKCYTCEEPTNGIFKVAKLDMLKKKI